MKNLKGTQVELGQQNKGLTTLLNVSKNLAGTLNVQRVMQESVDGVSKLFGLGTAAIYMHEGANVRLAATFPPLPPDFPDQFRLAKLTDHPHLKESITTGNIVHLPNIWEVELSEAEQAINVERDIYTLLFIPLITDQQVMGAFIVGSSGHPVDISPFEIDLSTTLANLAALAIKNALLFEDGKRYAADLEQSLQEREKIDKEREKLQEELFQVQKLDAIGQLAGGVAHDYNNQLGGIMGYADLLRHHQKDEEHESYVDSIITLAERSASLTKQLLLFSRKGPLQNKVVDIHQVIHEVVGILKHSISPQISITTDLTAAEPFIFGDASHIQNALLNLALNARDAMNGEGVILFRTGMKKWKEDCVLSESFLLASGTYIHIEVADTGSGIEQSTITRMFEPFFTTKGRGKGTGMGLAAVYGTVKTHNGGMEVQSQLGEGTVFHLYLPWYDAAEGCTIP